MDLKLNADRFSGKDYVKLYDKFRPSPPLEIIHQALNYLNQVKADCVIDLGCGTGKSIDIWNDYAHKIIGIDPSQEMIDIAKNKSKDQNHIQFLTAYSNKIPLPDQSADIISCSQSFHWMEPQSTFKEANRILKKDGLILIYDVIWPPSTNSVFEIAYNELFEQVKRITNKLEKKISHKWNKSQHFNNLQASSYFTFSKESYFHKTEKLKKEQFIGIAVSQGGLEALLKKGFTEDEIGLTRFKEIIHQAALLPYDEITYNYRVIFGKK